MAVAVAAIREAVGRLDVLVNNAAYNTYPTWRTFQWIDGGLSMKYCW